MRRVGLLLLLLLICAAPAAHATVTTTGITISYAGTGAQTSFPIPYAFDLPSDIVLKLDGVEQIYGSTYTVAKATGVAGGTLTTVTAPASGVAVVISRRTPRTQPVHYTPNAPFPATSAERAADRPMLALQEVELGAIVLPDSGVVPGTYTRVTVNSQGIVTVGSQANTGGCIDISGAPYNVTPAGAPATNRAGLQAAVDASPATGGCLLFPSPGVHINAAINVVNPLAIYGPGTTEVTTPGTFVLYLDTASQVGFNVTAKAPFVMQNMSVRGTTSTTAVVVNGPTGALKGTESVRLDNVVFYGGAIHLDVQAGIFWQASRSTFWNFTTAGVQVANTLDNDQGDSTLTANVFNGEPGAYGVLQRSGGGLKVTNNKFLGGATCLAVDRTGTGDTVDLILVGNSCENFTDKGFLITRSAGNLKFDHVQMIGNQIASYVNTTTSIGVQLEPTAGAGDLTQGFILSGNLINNVATAIRLRQVNVGVLTGNALQATGAAYDINNTALNVRITGDYPYDFVTLIGTATGVVMQGGKVTFAQLPAVGDGSYLFCADCDTGNPCAGGGDGRFATRRSGTWVCEAGTGGGGTVTSVSGTTNRVTSTGGATPVLDISGAYVGQASITTLGTVTTGTWNVSGGSVTAGTGVFASGSSLTLGAASTATGAVLFKNATNANTLTFQSGVSASSFALTLPTGDGSAGTCLSTNGSGVLGWANCSSGGTGLTSLGGQTGATQTFANDTNVQISSGSNTHTLAWAGTLARGRGGWGQDVSASTGLPTFNSGTPTFNNVLTDTRVLYGKTGNLVDSSAAFTFTVGTVLLDLNGSGGSPAAAITDSRIRVSGGPAASAFITTDTYQAPGLLTFRRAQGTVASPTTLTVDNNLGSVSFRGYDGSAYSSDQASYGCFAGATWSGSSHPTYCTWGTTPSASTTNTERLRVTAAGLVGINNTAPLHQLELNTNATVTPAAGTPGLAVRFNAANNPFVISAEQTSGVGWLGLGADQGAGNAQTYATSLLTPVWRLTQVGTATNSLRLQVAPAGTAGGAITWAVAMDVNSNGNTGIGTAAGGTSGTAKLAVGGVVESTSGGFKFPDGTTQSSAAVGGGNLSGSLTSGRVPVASGTNSVTDTAALTFDVTNVGLALTKTSTNTTRLLSLTSAISGPSWNTSRPLLIDATTSGVRTASGSDFVTANTAAGFYVKNTDSSTSASTALGDRTSVTGFVHATETSGFTGTGIASVSLYEINGSTSAGERAAHSGYVFVNSGSNSNTYAHNGFVGIASAVSSFGGTSVYLGELNCQKAQCATTAYGISAQNINSPFGQTQIAAAAFRANTRMGTSGGFTNGDAWTDLFVAAGDDGLTRARIRGSGAIATNLPAGTSDAALNLAINGATLFYVNPTGVAGSAGFAALTSTGSAGGKKVVCVDTATGALYASSTGTDCSN